MALIGIPTTPEREANMERNDGGSACLVCGRSMSEAKVDKAWHVHMTVSLMLAATDDEVGDRDSQGWFPVGSECAKLVPLTHRTKF